MDQVNSQPLIHGGFEGQRIIIDGRNDDLNSFYANYNKDDWDSYKLAVDQIKQLEEFEDATIRIYNELGELISHN